MSLAALALVAALTGPTPPIPLAVACTAAPGLSAAELLARADSALGIARTDGRILRWTGMSSVAQDYQSDRTYPPFFAAFQQDEGAYDPASGALRTTGKASFLSYGTNPMPVILSSAHAAWASRDSAPVPTASLLPLAGERRALLALPVIREWRAAGDATVDGICSFRDYPRVVLTRLVDGAPERLYLDPKTGMPVKLDRREPHYLWGTVAVEYVWSNWLATDGLLVPGSAFRVVEGSVVTSLIVTTLDLTPRDSVPGLRIPDPALRQTAAPPAFLAPTTPDTIRIGSTTFLLRNRGYTEAVALRRDTVFVFEATQGEERARADSTWIARLFPGPHPTVLVVTDLAWPHVAGIRFWVARGAIVVSHRAAESFLRSVVDRRWPETPDLLERLRREGRAPRWRFRAVDDRASLAGGEIVLAPIDGITSEVALIGWLPGERFLWGSDYVQDVSTPNEYVREVRAAAHRAGFTPDRVAAEHLPVTPWSTLEALVPAP